MSILIYERVVSVEKIYTKLNWDVRKRNIRNLWRSGVVILLIAKYNETYAASEVS